jgi:hypothetical protein
VNVVELILTVCLISNPSSCREERLRFENRSNLLNCMFLAPAEIAKWADQHPKLRVARWKCKFPSNEITL